MKKWLILVVALILFYASKVVALERTEAEAELKKKPLAVLGGQRCLFSSNYELSWIKLAGRSGYWRLFTNTLAYSFDNGVIPYLEIDSWERFHDKDQLVNAGFYFKFPDNSFLHSEIGFGQDITYLPRFRFLEEYERRLMHNIFWHFGYRYLNYADNDVNIVDPGLIYYFKDNFLAVFYNASFTESRGTAQWATFKGNFSVDGRLNFWAGLAVGERLYDIELLKASKQYGYIIFSGIDFKVYKDLKIRLGFSYSKERPRFIKRSFDCGLSVNF